MSSRAKFSQMEVFQSHIKLFPLRVARDNPEASSTLLSCPIACSLLYNAVDKSLMVELLQVAYQYLMKLSVWDGSETWWSLRSSWKYAFGLLVEILRVLSVWKFIITCVFFWLLKYLSVILKNKHEKLKSIISLTWDHTLIIFQI